MPTNLVRKAALRCVETALEMSPRYQRHLHLPRPVLPRAQRAGLTLRTAPAVLLMAG